MNLNDVNSDGSAPVGSTDIWSGLQNLLGAAASVYLGKEQIDASTQAAQAAAAAARAPVQYAAPVARPILPTATSGMSSFIVPALLIGGIGIFAYMMLRK